MTSESVPSGSSLSARLNVTHVTVSGRRLQTLRARATARASPSLTAVRSDAGTDKDTDKGAAEAGTQDCGRDDVCAASSQQPPPPRGDASSSEDGEDKPERRTTTPLPAAGGAVAAEAEASKAVEGADKTGMRARMMALLTLPSDAGAQESEKGKTADERDVGSSFLVVEETTAGKEVGVGVGQVVCVGVGVEGRVGPRPLPAWTARRGDDRTALAPETEEKEDGGGEADAAAAAATTTPDDDECAEAETTLKEKREDRRNSRENW